MEQAGLERIAETPSFEQAQTHSPTSVAERLVEMVETAFGSCPVRFWAWDGSEAGFADGPILVIGSPRALRRLVFDPDDVGLGRAFVSGDMSVDGDIADALDAIADFAVQIRRRRRLTWGTWARVVVTAARLGAIGRRPPAPPEEFHISGRLHSRSRDKAAVSSHYDVGNEFYRAVLGPSMVYSCGYWSDPSCSLEEAQRAKHDLICRKLGLNADMWVLDVGCGWGSFSIHAAREYGARVLGITVSGEQAEFARRRVDEAGLSGRVEIREQDWREVVERDFDAVASIGMAEHVGSEQYRCYAKAMWQLLRPGGRLLNHQIAAPPGVPRSRRRNFGDAFVFPDGELLPISAVTEALEDAGLEVRDVHCLREHYALTLRAWLRNLADHRQQCVDSTSEGRVRVWELYMAASAIGFERNVHRINQTLAVRPDERGRSHMPMIRMSH